MKEEEKHKLDKHEQLIEAVRASLQVEVSELSCFQNLSHTVISDLC